MTDTETASRRGSQSMARGTTLGGLRWEGHGSRVHGAQQIVIDRGQTERLQTETAETDSGELGGQSERTTDRKEKRDKKRI
jgi:hypothetical protein